METTISNKGSCSRKLNRLPGPTCKVVQSICPNTKFGLGLGLVVVLSLFPFENLLN